MKRVDLFTIPVICFLLILASCGTLPPTLETHPSPSTPSGEETPTSVSTPPATSSRTQTSDLQTELTTEVLSIASNFSDERTLSTIAEICYWIKDNFDCCIEADFGRHVSEILETRHMSGCHDYGVLFAALARAKGFDVNYIQTFRDYILHAEWGWKWGDKRQLTFLRRS